MSRRIHVRFCAFSNILCFMLRNCSPRRDEEQSDVLIAKIRDMKTHLFSTVSALEESEREHEIEIAAWSDKLKIAEEEIRLLHLTRFGSRDTLETTQYRDSVCQTVESDLDGIPLDSYADRKMNSSSAVDSGMNSTHSSVPDVVNRLVLERDSALKERDRANSLLALLKKHISETEMIEGDKFERRLQWKLSLEDQENTGSDPEYYNLKNDLFVEKQLNRQMHDDVCRLKSIIESKDNELSNLHSALGELSFENESGLKMRRTIRQLQDEIIALHTQIGKERHQMNSVIEEHTLLSIRESKALEVASEALQCQQKLQEGMSVLRNALKHSMLKLKQCGPDSDMLVDRRIVIQLLISYFERGCSDEVLSVMSKILGFTMSDFERIQKAGNKQGLLKRFVNSPLSVFHGVGVQSSNQSSIQDVDLAEAWVDYLIQNSDDSSDTETATK